MNFHILFFKTSFAIMPGRETHTGICFKNRVDSIVIKQNYLCFHSPSTANTFLNNFIDLKCFSFYELFQVYLKMKY